MALIVCVDGLAGHPLTTFGSLKKELEKSGHEVVLVDTSNVVSHSDRVRSVIKEAEAKESDIFLVGQSAGGSAVRIAAEKLESSGKKVSGIILLSPAMPRGIVFMTWTLLKVMIARLGEILTGKTIETTELEYRKLVGPLPAGTNERVVSSRTEVSGAEARELAFFPPGFVGPTCPVLHVWGTEDRWISPKAQKKLTKKLGERACVSTIEISGSGHLVLESGEKEKLIGLIRSWIENGGS